MVSTIKYVDEVIVYRDVDVDNLGLIIDHDTERNRHNSLICKYIEDKVAYNDYLDKICDELGRRELSIIDRVFHPQTLKECTRLLFKHWIRKIKGKDAINDFPLQRLLTHDARRNLLLRTLKNYNHERY